MDSFLFYYYMFFLHFYHTILIMQIYMFLHWVVSVLFLFFISSFSRNEDELKTNELVNLVEEISTEQSIQAEVQLLLVYFRQIYNKKKQSKKQCWKTNMEIDEERSIIAVRSVGKANKNKSIEFLEVRVIKENYKSCTGQ